MKLYKVFQGDCEERGYYTKYIVAIDKSKSIEKYLKIHTTEIAKSVTSIFICERDNIIPTLEPLKEFKNES